MKLNSNQNKALLEIFEFLNSERNFYILSGCAGSGKTTLVKSVLKNLNNISVRVAALTHKAASVLEGYTGGEATTLHRTLGIKMEETPKGLKPVFPASPRIPRDQQAVVIVDEISMMDRELWNYIKETYSGSQVKWLLVGDRNQLPGVGAKIPVFFAGIPESHLSVGVRQQKRSLELLCKHLQTCVVEGSQPDLEIFASEDVFFTDFKDIGNTLESFDPEKDMLLAYSNKEVVKLILEYRSHTGQESAFQEGERVYALSRIKTAFGHDCINTDEEFILVKKEEIIEEDLSMWEIQVGTSKRYIYAERFIEYRPQNGESPIMRPFYGRTIHKAQGSTYRNVFIDLGSFTRANTQEMCNRLLYIAASRPTNAIYFIGQLPKRLGAL